MEFFDCNCAYGVAMKPPLASALTTAEVLTEMDFCGVQRALIRDFAVSEETPEVGNLLTSQAAAGHDRLTPAWGILPPQTEELGTVSEFITAMGQAGVRALYAFPSGHRYLLNRTTFGGLFEEMVSRGLPLFLPRSETSGGLDAYATADSVLRDFPRLHLIITAQGSWGEDRLFRPLMEAYPNFAVDTSRYELDGGIAEVCQKYGPHRLYFGTNFPHTPMGGPMLTLLHAKISDEDRAWVAGGNLKRVLGL
ncbi:MAG: amidohydrolase family protein [Bacteroidota bacterium]